MIKIVFTLTALLWATAAHSQAAPSSAAPPKPAAAPPSNYCVTASGGFLRSDADGYAALNSCSRGDTVVLPGGSTSVIAQVCDFTKAIVAAGGNVVCSIISPARVRR